ncbi:MAG TPA: hypothetical protein VHB21_11025 [Minicystis sp.]|nr:hypothetical protein [Minicystis sp.]
MRTQLFLLVSALGAVVGCGGPSPAGSGAGGAGGDASGSTQASTSQTTGPVAVAATGVGGSGGGGAVACDPAAPPGSFWAQTATEYGKAQPTGMCAYRGDVVLVVNVAEL